MTPNQRSLKINLLKTMIESAGFTIDRFGNYKATSQEQEYRIKFMPVNIRIERKLSTNDWHKIISEPISQIDFTTIAKFIKRNIQP